MTDIDETKIRRLDFTLLLVFRALIRHRRTTVAAQQLGLSQSAVSHALARLRDLFEEPLFLRRPDGLQPTRAALALAPKIEALLALAGETVEGARRFDPATSERVFRIAANDFVVAMLAPLLAGALERQAPGIRFALGFAIGPKALEALRSDAVDLAIGRFGALPDGYASDWLGDEGYVVAARKAHPALAGGLDLVTYLGLGHILVSFQGGIRGTADQALAKLGENRRVATSVPTFLTALGVAAASDHLATVPARLGQRYAADFGLVLHPVPFAIETFAVVAVRHARAAGDEGLAWLLARVRALWGPADTGRATRH